MPASSTPSAGLPPDRSARDLLREVMAELRALEKSGHAWTRARTLLGPEAEAAERREAAAERERAKPPREGIRLTTPAIVLIGLLAIVGAAVTVGLVVTAEMRRTEVSSALRDAETDLAILQTTLKNAEEARHGERWPQALEGYRRAFQSAQSLAARLERTGSKARRQDDRRKIAAATAATAQAIKAAEAALARPEIKFGGQGLVQQDGEWISPAEKQRRFEEKMKAEKKQFYEGAWRTEDEINKMRGLIQHGNRWVTREELDRLIAEEKKAAAEAAATPVPVVPTTLSKAPTFDPQDPRWVLDDFEKTHSWSSVTWANANPCQLTLQEGSASGRLTIALPGGPQDKSAIARQLRLDLSSRGRLLMDIENLCDMHVPVAIAIETDQYYESRPQMLKPGLNAGVVFDLKSGDFKAKTTQWSPAAKIGRPQSALSLYILIYHKEAGRLVLDNLVAQGG